MMLRDRLLSFAAIAFAALFAFAPVTSYSDTDKGLQGPIDSQLFDTLHWRNIGPFLGGRVDAVAGIPGDPLGGYFGAVAGGVWRTTNAGVTWAPITDHAPFDS